MQLELKLDSIEDLVDAYIAQKSQIDILQAELDDLADSLKRLGIGDWTGTKGAVKISHVAGRSTTDWTAVRMRVLVPQEVVDACTKVGAPSFRITVKKP
jgi:hypothetical protein